MKKDNLYRDPDLLKLAQGEECLLRISPKCRCEEGSTTVACHANDLIRGKGKGIKSSDAFTVWGCHACHTLLDQGTTLSKQEKKKLFDQAWFVQIQKWHDIANSLTIKPWRKEAAERVLKHIGATK